MESDEGDIVDIFEDENEGQADGTENQESTNDASTGTKVPVPKRIIKNPRLKFNADRLCGERGIPILVDHFKNVKFKGKDHEKEDLDKLLSHLEHWTHRLFPSMKFEDCLNQIEKLGKKRPVQTCLRKIRLDMPIRSSDFIENDDDDDKVLRNDDLEPPSNEDAFDKLIQESQDLLNSNTSDNFDCISTTYSSPLPTSAAGQVLGSSFGSGLSAEQKERMERNKMLAAERRKARLSALQTNTSTLAQGNDKIVDSEASVTHDNFFDKPNSFAKENNFDVITKSISTENINNENNISILSDQTSEKLGLDDLVDFIDEEPEPSKKLAFDDSNLSDNLTKSTEKEVCSQNRISDDECIEIGCGASDITKKLDYSISSIVYDKMENNSSDIGIKRTAEQKERMERNKLLAVERRKARLSGLQTNTPTSAQENDEMADSQVSVTHDIYFDQHNNVDVITRSISTKNINNKNDTSILSDQTSEKLGLDDLVDFIDEEPEPSKKHAFDESNSSDNLKNTEKEMHSQNRVSDDESIEIGCGASDITRKLDDSISSIVCDKIENNSSDIIIKRNNKLDCSENLNENPTLNNTITHSVEVLNDTFGNLESIEDSISDINDKTKYDCVDVDETLYKEDHTLNITTKGSTKAINNESGIIENMDVCDNFSDAVGGKLDDISKKHLENDKCLKSNADLENEVLNQKKMPAKDCVDVKNVDDGVSGAVNINLRNVSDASGKGIEAKDDCLELDELMDLVDK